MSVIEALITIKNSIYNIEVKATESNIHNVSNSISLLNALIELENKRAEQANSSEEEPSDAEQTDE